MQLRRFFRKAVTVAVVLGGSAVLPAAVQAIQATPASAAPAAMPGAVACQPGLVWRQTWTSDYVCVTPADQQLNAAYNAWWPYTISPNGGAYGPYTCRQGYVWREAIPYDLVCVPPSVRDTEAYNNTQAGANQIQQVSMPITITFSNGVPVGGWFNLTMNSSGQVTISGHYHDSGATTYDEDLVVSWRTNTGVAFEASHSFTTYGTFDSGSRDSFWNQSSVDPSVTANWAAISTGSGHWTADANLNLGAIWNDIQTAYTVIKTAAPIVVALF
jgi:hypothetical protein